MNDFASKLESRARIAASKFRRSRPDANVLERDCYIVRLADHYGYRDSDEHWFWEAFVNAL